MKLPTLYKISSTGAVQQWDIEAKASVDNTAVIIVTHGQKDGKFQTSKTRITQGKNIGKANETTPLEQAIAESKSKWLKQIDKGYTENPEGEKLVHKPMLAHDYKKYKHKVIFPSIIQPKLDGMRCIAKKGQGKVTLWSRQGKEISTVPHINSALGKMMRDGEVWDGELYIHGEPFQSLMSLVKRAQKRSCEVEYHIYDVIENDEFGERYHPVVDRLTEHNHRHIKPVYTRRVMSHQEIKDYHDAFIGEGYEGAIVRNDTCPYKEGYRSQDLLKVKDFQDSEYLVVDAKEGKGKFEGMAIFICRTPEGVEFDCMPKGTDAQRRDYWNNRTDYIGQKLTVRYFSLTDSNPPVPRFPVGVGFRID